MRRLVARAALTAALAPGPLAGVVAPLAAQGTEAAYLAAHYAKREVRIPMRDGVRLFTTVYLPRDAGRRRRYPILLQRTPFSAGPYGADAYPEALGPSPFMLRDGYVYVNQEVRGRYRSEGTFENVRPLLSASRRARNPRATDEATDAWDTIEWLLHHLPEQDGRVGLLGVSYGGYYAAAAAVCGHPAIVATSLQAPVMDFFFEDFHHNGALLLGHVQAYPVFGVPRPRPTGEHWWLPQYQHAAERVGDDDYAGLLALGPLRDLGARVLPGNTWWGEIAAHPNDDAFWRARAMAPRLRGVTHPVLVVGGWFDAENLYGTLAAYHALRANGARAAPVLVMGPWGHRGWSARGVAHTTHGDLAFGDGLETAYQRDVEAVFFRAHLKRAAGAAPTGARVFDTGRKRWVHFAGWPAARAAPRRFYFRADGSLAGSPQAGGPAFVEYASDPGRPVPARCHGPTIEDGVLFRYMSDDQRCFASRPDVAVFQTGALARDVTVAGRVDARLWVSTTATDADFVVKLIDVSPPDAPGRAPGADATEPPGGYQQLVRGEIMRGRFRRSFRAPAPFRPGRATLVPVLLPDVFHTFRKGHRMMVQVQSSWFPLFDRNPQRYVPSIYLAGERDFVPARHRVWVGRGRASALEAPVLAAGASGEGGRP